MLLQHNDHAMLMYVSFIMMRRRITINRGSLIYTREYLGVHWRQL